MKPIITVFPDYCSSGFWNADGANICEPECLPSGLLLGFRYWHEVWEFELSSEDGSLSDVYKRRWLADGQLFVDHFNHIQDQYQFVYKVDEAYAGIKPI
jgi:hypothetical protein